MEHNMAIVLAAGEGKRMKSNNAKVVQNACGKALIEWVYHSLMKANISDITLVVGHQKEQVKKIMGNKINYAVQDVRLGTAHAVMQAEEFYKNKDGTVIILCGDTPLITSQTILDTISYHKECKNSVTIISAELEDPTGYGRIIRDQNNNVLKIVEHKDASPNEKLVREVNSGMYCFEISSLKEALKEINNNNSQQEYYLTDSIEILINKGRKVGATKVKNSQEILGINDRIQLNQAAEILKLRILNKLMSEGVTIIDKASTFIDAEVEIGIDSIIYPSTIIEGRCKIGENCIVGPNSRILNSEISSGAKINNSVVLESFVGENTNVGPFAYIRPQSSIGKSVKIGDFVEIKKSKIGDNTKISHLSYVGDAEIGNNVNLGCGVVVVNYNGKQKNKTVVGDNAFVGCNVNLISPVVVNNNAYIAAGSTITDEVPENSLAIARCRQEIKKDWVTKKNS